MTLEQLLPIIIPSTFVALLVLERLAPGRALPRVKRWLPKGLAFFVLIMAMNAIIPAVMLSFVQGVSLFELRSLGTVGGALVALVAGDLLFYWIHRGMHTSDFVWRWTHQLHHSAERLDMLGATYFHPFDFLFQNVIPGTLLMVALGITPEAGALAGFLGFLVGVFPHLNVKTPRWLGYFIQRPEMHAIHHQRGVHAYNYGSLALSDLVYGTWRNPETFHDAPYGFWEGASSRVGAMLLGRDINRA